MKKGFTLVELLGVIILLGVIMLIAFPIIDKTIDDSKKEAYDMQIKMILEAAHNWAIDNAGQLPNDDSEFKLTITELIEKGYIKDVENGTIQNPLDKTQPMNGCVVIKYSNEYNQYIYNYNEKC